MSPDLVFSGKPRKIFVSTGTQERSEESFRHLGLVLRAKGTLFGTHNLLTRGMFSKAQCIFQEFQIFFQELGDLLRNLFKIFFRHESTLLGVQEAKNVPKNF